MSRVALSAFVALALSTSAYAQSSESTFPATPLASKHFAYPSGIPYQADTDTTLIRGDQSGYNICNSTTETQTSMCQTSFINALDDFCLWAPAPPNSTIADTEADEVAWCSKPGHGTRLMPEGTLQGVQFMTTTDYIQVVGFLDQTQVNMNALDYGGELDPHGADLRGNPLGGLMYSNAYASNNGNNASYQQVIQWNLFIGSGTFCFKACDPAGPNAAALCQNIFDRIGCSYNMPNAAQNGTFEKCDGDLQDPAGIYTSNGVVMTYTQPAESLGAISTMPYQPRVPASSNCVTYSSAELFTSLPTQSNTASGAGATGTGAAGASGKGGASGSGATRSGSAAGATNTTSGGMLTIVGSSFAGIMGVIFAVAFLS